MLATVATSTLSGLCVGALTWAAGTVFKPRLLAAAAPLWSVIGTGASLLVALYFLWAQRRSSTSSTKRVFLVLPAFDQKHYVAELVRDLHHVLEKHGFVLELEIPDRDYSTVGQAYCLNRLLAHKHDYVGGFVIPVIPHRADQIKNDLVDFCRQVDIPVVFVDVEPFGNEQQYPNNTAYVGYDASEIGDTAAIWSAEHLSHLQKPVPVVLIVTGDSQHQRQERYKDELSARLSAARIIETNGSFDRQCARDVTRRQLRQLRMRNEQLDLVFCTNDEMALGATDALLVDGPPSAHTVVIGVDGTPQARALIDTGPSPLRATVRQDPYKVAETAADLLERLRRRSRVPTRTVLPCEIMAQD